MLEPIRWLFTKKVAAGEVDEALRWAAADLARTKNQHEQEIASLNLAHADELESLKRTLDQSESDLAAKTHELAAANARTADYKAAFEGMEAAVAATDEENIRIKARVAEAVGLLQS